MIVPPGLSSPARSASSIICTAMRSLIELPGLNVSIFASTVALTTPRVMRLIRTSGVSPMASRMVSQIGLNAASASIIRARADRSERCGHRVSGRIGLPRARVREPRTLHDLFGAAVVTSDAISVAGRGGHFIHRVIERGFVRFRRLA